MSGKTILIESNNSASKLYTDRQLRKGVIGKSNIKKDNSSWKTDLKYGIKLEEGDEITIDGTQINLRGSPDASMEFSGGLNSQYDDNNSLVDNVTTVEYGYYFTNNKQYNFNLPMTRHIVVGGERWWKPEFGLWNGERDVDAILNNTSKSPWNSFRQSYPAWAIEGCYKATESQPGTKGTAASGSTPAIPPAKQVNTVTRWNVVATEDPTGIPSQFVPPSIGKQGCGSETETAISNGPFSIAHSNEKRLYLLEDMDSFYFRTTIKNQSWTTNSSDYLKTDMLPLTTREGFQTPSSVAQDLTEQLHEREGTANNWTDSFEDSSIYLHDAQFFLALPEQSSPTTTQILSGGYDWSRNTKLSKYPVSQVSDKMLKIVKTAGGSLLEKVFDALDVAESPWYHFIADIPGNDGWRGNVDDGSGQEAVGNWNNFVDASGNKGGDTFPSEEGKKLFYENLLCGEIGRHNAYITQQQLIAKNSICIGEWVDDVIAGNSPTPDEIFTNITPLKREPSSASKLYSDIVYLNMGALIGYNMAPSDWDVGDWRAKRTYFPACQFGQDKIVSTDYWGTNQDSNPQFEELSPVPHFTSGSKSRVGNDPATQVSNATVIGIKQSNNMVWPTNIIATPRSIAQLKKLLWINRKTKKLFDVSKSAAGKVRDDCQNKDINSMNVAELEYYFLDDGATIGTNSPAGFADPNDLTGKFVLPCPYACAQTEGLGAPSGFDARIMKDSDFTYKRNFFESEIPAEPFQYDVSSGEGSAPVRLQTSLRQGTRHNRLNFKTSWEDAFENYIDYSERNEKDGIYLNPRSIFKFTNADGEYFQHMDWLKPQDPKNPLFDGDKTNRYDLWDEQEPEMDSGVALAVVYYQEFSPDAPQATDIVENYPNVSVIHNPNQAGDAYPGTPDFAEITDPEERAAKKKIFYNTPFLALIMTEGVSDVDVNKDPLTKFFLPPMIGENFGISHAFSDGEYAKVVTTQRANPKPYNTITSELAQTNTQFGNFTSRHNPLYYNLYDYVPYCLIGAEDPNVQFGGDSGRFEISSLHTPLYVSNGSWNDIAKEGDTASAQAGEKIASLNNKLAWISTISWQTNFRGVTISNGALSGGTGRDADGYIIGENTMPHQSKYSDAADPKFQVAYYGYPVIPWGELQQDSNEHKVITSQSGIGIVALYVPYSNQNIPDYLRDVNNKAQHPLLHERMSAWYPNTFNDTLFHKMGFEIEQLIPFVYNNQSNGFNRSNYNKFIGCDGQNLYDKQNNMVSPLTTNGYISGPINIEGQNRNWFGFDTIYEMARTMPSTEELGWGTFPEFIGILDDRGDSSSVLRKILPAGQIFDMYSMGGLNYMTGTQVTIESDVLVASKQPKKFDYSYLVVYSDIIEQNSNFIGSNKILPLPAVGYLNRNYSSSDFFYSFQSDFKYVADRAHVINNFNVEIRLPNGKSANLEDNSSVIFKIIKQIPAPLQLQPPKPPTKKELTKEQKEKELYYKSLIG